MLNALSYPIRLLWPEGLMVTAAAIYLGAVQTLAIDAPGRSARVRMLSSVGLFVTGCTVLLGSMPSLYTIIAIPLIPAPFAFGVLIYKPGRISQWNRLRIYLTISVVISALAWATQFVWLATR